MASKGKRTSYKSFAGIPRAIMDTDQYKALSGSAVKLLNELCYQFRGANNGDLTCAWHVLKHRGFNSRTTIEKARDELLAVGFIVRSRTGFFTNPGGVCALYALAWLPVDECPGKNLEINPTTKPITPASEFKKP